MGGLVESLKMIGIGILYVIVFIGVGYVIGYSIGYNEGIRCTQ